MSDWGQGQSDSGKRRPDHRHHPRGRAFSSGAESSWPWSCMGRTACAGGRGRSPPRQSQAQGSLPEAPAGPAVSVRDGFLGTWTCSLSPWVDIRNQPVNTDSSTGPHDDLSKNLQTSKPQGWQHCWETDTFTDHWFGGRIIWKNPLKARGKKFPSLNPVTSSLKIFSKKKNSNYRKPRKRRSFAITLLWQVTGDLAESIMVKLGLETYVFVPDSGRKLFLCALVSFSVK